MSDEVYGPDGERLIPFAPVVEKVNGRVVGIEVDYYGNPLSIPADWDLITAGDGRHCIKNRPGEWLDYTNGGIRTDAEILALGPVRRCVPVTVPEEGAPVVYAMPSRLDSRKVAIRDLAGTGATDVWPSDAKRYAAELLAAALKAEEGR